MAEEANEDVDHPRTVDEWLDDATHVSDTEAEQPTMRQQFTQFMWSSWGALHAAMSPSKRKRDSDEAERKRAESQRQEEDAPMLSPEEFVKLRYDYMHADKSNLKDVEKLQRFTDPLSISIGVAYECPCCKDGGRDCMTQCDARSYEFIRQKREIYLKLTGRSNERELWLKSRIDGAVQIDEETGEFKRQKTVLGAKNGRARVLNLQVNGVNVCPDTFRNIFGISQRTLERHLKRVKEDAAGILTRRRGDKGKHTIQQQISEDHKAHVSSWIISHAEDGAADSEPFVAVVGEDAPPDSQPETVLRLHERFKCEVYKLYVAYCVLSHRASIVAIRTFLAIWTASASFVKLARAKANFSVCTQCENFKAALQNTRLTDDERREARELYTAHLNDQNSQRSYFYKLVKMANQEDPEIITISHDKMSKQSTTLPRSNVKANSCK